MFNPVTDRLKLVEKILVRGRSLLGGILLLDQDVPAIEGVSQEIFRDGVHIDSVCPASFYPDDSLNIGDVVKARKGDSIYCIQLVPQPYTITGTIQTQDFYQRIYEMQVILEVKHPAYMIEWYLQSKDPAGWIIDHLKRNFESWAASMSHDQLENTKPSSSLERTIQLLCNQCGIKITRYRWSFRVDPLRAQDLEFRHKTELKKIEMRNAHETRMIEIQNEHAEKALEEKQRREREREQKIFDLEEKLRNNNFLREERRRNQQNAAYIQLLSETVKDLVEINRGQIHDAFEYDGVVKAVLQNSVQLLKIFEGPVSEEDKIIETVFSDATTPFEEKDDVAETDRYTDFSFSAREVINEERRNSTDAR